MLHLSKSSFKIYPFISDLVEKEQGIRIRKQNGVDKKKKFEDQEIKELSDLQKKLREDSEASRSKKDRENLRIQRNRIT